MAMVQWVAHGPTKLEMGVSSDLPVAHFIEFNFAPQLLAATQYAHTVISSGQQLPLFPNRFDLLLHELLLYSTAVEG
jgi:hypothetical protein